MFTSVMTPSFVVISVIKFMKASTGMLYDSRNSFAFSVILGFKGLGGLLKVKNEVIVFFRSFKGSKLCCVVEYSSIIKV